MDYSIPSGLPQVVDGSWLRPLQMCKRKAYLRHGLHLVPKVTAVALSFGSAVHEAIHIWYAGGKTVEAALGGIKAFCESYTPPEGDRRTHELGALRLQEYFQRYASEPFEIAETEIGFALPLEGEDIHTPIVYGGRMDRIVKMQGRHYPVETKTASKLGSYWFRQWRPDLSITGYVWAVGTLFKEHCTGCIMDAISTDKDPREPLLRDITNRMPPEIEEFKRTVYGLCADWLDRCDEAAKFGPLQAFFQEPASCHFYSGCEYRQLCTSGLSETLVEEFFDVEPWEPYPLKGEKNEAKRGAMALDQTRNPRTSTPH